jgi:DNA-directed RNA polymerase subunit RPC12/RpoP
MTNPDDPWDTPLARASLECLQIFLRPYTFECPECGYTRARADYSCAQCGARNVRPEARRIITLDEAIREKSRYSQ